MRHKWYLYGLRLLHCFSISHIHLTSTLSMASSRTFFHALPPARLGIAHETLASFNSAVCNETICTNENNPSNQNPRPSPIKSKKEYTLIMVTETCNERILLGLKHRGFGTGFYNSFGGKIDPTDPSIAYGAVRELKEETNISVPLNIMEKSYLGKLEFTFEDNDKQMIVHVFRIHVQCFSHSTVHKDGDATATSTGIVPVVTIDPNDIKPPDDGEITPMWFNNWYEIPMYMMHADDSLWIPLVLDASMHIKKLDGWFHFAPGGPEVNTILHHHITFC